MSLPFTSNFPSLPISFPMSLGHVVIYIYIYIFYEKKRENDSEKSTVKTYKYREKYLKPRDIERRVVKICYNSFWYKVAKGTKWFVRV